MRNRTFLVEAYAPAESELVTLLDQARRAAVPGAPGEPIEHVRSFLVAEDETCFHLFEATSIDALRAAMVAVDIHANRIVEVAT